MEDQYALSWMSFTNNLISGYQDLYKDQTFTDVTLAADDITINCHRAVLAISSEFFRKMLENCPPNNHPIIYLSNISNQNLKNLIEFIYFGETRVDHADLSQFILNAESLQIKGLTGTKSVANKPTKPPAKRKATTSVSNQAKTSKIEEVQEPEYINEEDLEHIKAAEERDNLSTEYHQIEEIEEPAAPQQQTIEKIDDNPDDPTYIPDYENTDEDYQAEDYDMGFTQDGDDVKFIRSQKHNAQLVYNMCIYNRKKMLQNGCTTWRCCENLKYKCKAVCITLDDKFVSARHRHNHPNHWEKIANRPLHDRSEFELTDLIEELEDKAAIIQYVSSSRNSLQIYHEGHIFNRYNSKSNANYWRCTQYHNMDCRAKLITYSNPQKIVVKNSKHTHEIIDGRLKYGTSKIRRKKIKKNESKTDK